MKIIRYVVWFALALLAGYAANLPVMNLMPPVSAIIILVTAYLSSMWLLQEGYSSMFFWLAIVMFTLCVITGDFQGREVVYGVLYTAVGSLILYFERNE
jgi:hypothetical protein